MDNIIEKANLDVFSETLLELGKKNKDIIVVTSDSRGSGKLVPFAEQLPDQLIEVGTGVFGDTYVLFNQRKSLNF